MDSTLAERLNKLNEQNDILSRKERIFLGLDANKKVMAAQLFLKAQGKSVAEKEAVAFSGEDWQNFVKGLAQVESEYLFERRRFDILEKAFQAEYLTMKRESDIIPKHGRSGT